MMKNKKTLLLLFPLFFSLASCNNSTKIELQNFTASENVYDKGETIDFKINIKHESTVNVSAVEINDTKYEVEIIANGEENKNNVYSYILKNGDISLSGFDSFETFEISKIFYFEEGNTEEKIYEVNKENDYSETIKLKQNSLISNEVTVGNFQIAVENQKDSYTKTDLTTMNYTVDLSFKDGNEDAQQVSLVVKNNITNEERTVNAYRSTVGSSLYKFKYFQLEEIDDLSYTDFDFSIIKVIKNGETINLESEIKLQFSIASNETTIKGASIYSKQENSINFFKNKKGYNCIEKGDTLSFKITLKHYEKNIDIKGFEYKVGDTFLTPYNYTKIKTSLDSNSETGNTIYNTEYKIFINFGSAKDYKLTGFKVQINDNDYKELLLNTTICSYTKIFDEFDDLYTIFDEDNGRYILKNDIDFNDSSKRKQNNEYIESSSLFKNFTGEFDGNGCSFKNFATKAPLFESIAETSYVHDFKYNFNYNSNHVAENDVVFVGKNAGIIDKVTLNGNISLNRYTNNFSGLIKENKGVIQNLLNRSNYDFSYANSQPDINLFVKTNVGKIQKVINIPSYFSLSANTNNIYFTVEENTGEIYDYLVGLDTVTSNFSSRYNLGKLGHNFHIFTKNGLEFEENKTARLYYISDGIEQLGTQEEHEIGNLIIPESIKDKYDVLNKTVTVNGSIKTDFYNGTTGINLSSNIWNLESNGYPTLR